MLKTVVSREYLGARTEVFDGNLALAGFDHGAARKTGDREIYRFKILEIDATDFAVLDTTNDFIVADSILRIGKDISEFRAISPAEVCLITVCVCKNTNGIGRIINIDFANKHVTLESDLVDGIQRRLITIDKHVSIIRIDGDLMGLVVTANIGYDELVIGFYN